MQILLVLITFSLSAAHGRFVDRDETTSIETLTEPLFPSPTFTNQAVVSAYNVYVEKCGTDLNVIVNSALPVYIQEGGPPDTKITDTAFVQFLEQLVGEYDPAVEACHRAAQDYEGTTATAAPSPTDIPSPTTMKPPQTSQPEATSTDDNDFSFSECIPPFSGFPSGISVPTGLGGIPSLPGFPNFPTLAVRDSQPSFCQSSDGQPAGTGTAPAPTNSHGGASVAQPGLLVALAVAVMIQVAA
ncbi:hypothetical protein MVEN_00607100 [Mycena venus]|uniref:Uncharacterized protein n=1 Tax=Mycena venus TaxID=2733690 RepID=A0A8H6YQA5_9AGAR|nr:hypothetical protein MVEN_00607100 [Mycena venus]